MIYLDNAATTLKKPHCVAEAVMKALCTMGNSSRGTHDSALQSARSVFSARMALAELFRAPGPEQVVFTQNATEALNIALNGLFSKGDHVITTDLEHNSVLRPLYRLEDTGEITLSVVPADKRGCVDYGDFERLIRPETRAIVCTHASNLTGNVLDLERIGGIARAHGLLFVVDASQTAGVYPIDMERMGVSVLCFTGHKGLLGPQGTGGLCIARDDKPGWFFIGGYPSFLCEFGGSFHPVFRHAGEHGGIGYFKFPGWWRSAEVLVELETELANLLVDFSQSLPLFRCEFGSVFLLALQCLLHKAFAGGAEFLNPGGF